MRVMNSCMKMLWGSQYLTSRKEKDAFAPIVSELAGQYINLQVIQKFTHGYPVEMTRRSFLQDCPPKCQDYLFCCLDALSLHLDCLF